MLNKDQEQKVTDGSTAIQAGGNVTIVKIGVTVDEARTIALDVYRSNFYELAGSAKEVAEARAEEITEKFLSALQKKNPAGLGMAKDPDFLCSLFTIQKEHAKNGDKDLGDLLVDLLVERSKLENRDIMQIVLNESINTAPKLTENQLCVLAVVFVLKYTQHHGIGNLQLFGEYLDQHIAPFAPKIVKNLACYQHLEFAGCGAIGLGSNSLESIFSRTFQGLFLKGFDAKAVVARNISVGIHPRLFIPCLNDPSKLQVNALNADSLATVLKENWISPEDSSKIMEMFDVEKMDEAEVRNKCVQIRPYMSGLFDTWSESAMKNFTLTTVGIAIGHANIKRTLSKFANLSIWIN